MYAIYQLPADITLINTKTIVLDLNEGYSHNTYQGLSKRRLCLEYVRRKVSNMPGVNLRQYFAFAHTSSFSPRVITGLEPAIQTKTSTWSVVNLKKNTTSISSKPEHAMWSSDTGQRIPCFDNCQI